MWASTTQPAEGTSPTFGHGSKVFNVIDVRQSYLQDVVRAGLRALGYEQQADDSIHFSYEMVALTPRCCAELGIELFDIGNGFSSGKGFSFASCIISEAS